MSDIALPYISVQTTQVPAAPILPVNVMLTAVVEELLAASQYRINVNGTLLDVALPYNLKPQQQIPIRIREVTPNAIYLDVSPPKTSPASVIADAEIEDLLKRMDLPRREDTTTLVREFLRQRAPVNRETISAAMESTHGEPARVQAAAFLAARGVQPDPQTLDQLVRMTQPQTEPSAPAKPNPILEAVARAVQPREGEQAVRSAFGTSPLPEVDREIARVLDANPRLRTIDRALSMLEQAAAAKPQRPGGPPPSPLETARQVARLVQMAIKGEITEQALREESPQVLRELRMRLLDSERREISNESILAQAREAKGTLFDALDRAQGFRFVNQLLFLHDENSALVEIPVRDGGRRESIPVRIVRRRGRGKGGGKGTATLTIDTDLTALGRVRTRIEAREKNLGVRMEVRDREVRERLESGLGELREALREVGFDSTLRVDVKRPPEDPLLFPAGGESSYTVIDVQA